MVHLEVQCNVDKCEIKFVNVYKAISHIVNKHKCLHESLNIHENFIDNFPVNAFAPNNDDGLESCDNSNSVIDSVSLKEKDFNSDKVAQNKSNFKSTILKLAFTFITQMYAFGLLNRKLNHKIIIDLYRTFITSSFSLIKSQFPQYHDLSYMLDIVQDGFNLFKTEY